MSCQKHLTQLKTTELTNTISTYNCDITHSKMATVCINFNFQVTSK